MGSRVQQDPVAPPVQRPFTMERETKGGRKLLYRATILQEPERARACGSGLKSTNDRRPVDPPPVVELRIFDITPGREQRDITFNYNANFFVFTSLRLARPMAHGRVQTPAATSPPVLTGVPCSGIAYLDRPEEAGYFLFPDLSVRHEGRYKLAFTLYEETKEQPDFDLDDNSDPQEPQYFCFRMEMESEPFTVYSAKKFPGLTESTTLSRNLSEQGVRVRIRRDVRMRRRDGKGGGGGGTDSQKAEGEYSRRQAQTPEHQQPIDHYRQRSSSATSEHGRIPYDVARRQSGSEYPPVPAPPPPVAYGNGSAGGNLNFNHGHQYPPNPSPTTPTFSTGHPSPIKPPPSPYGPPSIRAESPLSRPKYPVPPSPRSMHQSNGSVTSLPGINTVLDPALDGAPPVLTLPPMGGLPRAPIAADMPIEVDDNPDGDMLESVFKNRGKRTADDFEQTLEWRQRSLHRPAARQGCPPKSPKRSILGQQMRLSFVNANREPKHYTTGEYGVDTVPAFPGPVKS